MEENNYCIYGHRNKINGKWYIGQTIHGDNPEKRWRNGRGYCCGTQSKFARGIQKYGWDNFEHIILKENLTKEEANHWEKYYIKYYNSKENGYNLTEGGEGTVGFIPSEETRKKMSEARNGKYVGEKNPNYGKHHTEETRKKMREALKGKFVGEKNPLYGKHHSEETRKKMSEAHKNPSEETRKKMSEANKNPSEETRKKMSEAHKGKHHTEKTRKKMSEARRGEKNSNAKKVLCIETNEIFSCGKECAEKMNINYSTLRYCCRHNAKSTDNHYTAGGYHFIYIEE